MSKPIALTFYASSDEVRVSLGRQARFARQEEDGSIATRSYDWTWRDRSDPFWDEVPVIAPDEFDALYGARK